MYNYSCMSYAGKGHREKEQDNAEEQMNRRQEREAAFMLIFERSFHKEESPEEIYEHARQARDIEESEYVRRVFFGVEANKEELDGAIEKYSRGWKTARISHVSRSIMELSIYEMRYCPEIPLRVSMNEAIELARRYDEEAARPFVNGILNAVAEEQKRERDGE